MTRKALTCLLAVWVIVVSTGCTSRTPASNLLPLKELGITVQPAPMNYERGKLDAFPSYSVLGGGLGVDLLSYDLSRLKLDDKLDDLLCAVFDSKTKWPDTLPQGFDPARIMELAKDPGLGLRALHESGIDGRRVGIAIIDLPLLVDHVEYKDRLKHYEEIHNMEGESAVVHGPAVASIAVGKTVGVAPGADLYYIAESSYEQTDKGMVRNVTSLATAIDRVLEINNPLPAGEKIRVLCIAKGWGPSEEGYTAVNKAVQRAEKAGIFVISSVTCGNHSLGGLDRDPYADPNSVASFLPGADWAERFYAGVTVHPTTPLLIPMDNRCTASPTGPTNYVYYTGGGLSWVFPYLAGLYALACQVKPDITPDEFWAASLSTGDTIQVEKDGNNYSMGKIVNPQALIQKLGTK